MAARQTRKHEHGGYERGSASGVELCHHLYGREEMAGPMVSIKGLDHIVLRCEHLEPMLTFYQEVLGCRLERHLEDLGLYQLRAGAHLIDIVPVGSPLGGCQAPDLSRANLAHFCLLVEPPKWSELCHNLHESGINTEPPASRYGATGHGLSIYIRDPQGNTVELKSADSAHDVDDIARE